MSRSATVPVVAAAPALAARADGRGARAGGRGPVWAGPSAIATPGDSVAVAAPRDRARN